jgi:hypothetical protein
VVELDQEELSLEQEQEALRQQRLARARALRDSVQSPGWKVFSDLFQRRIDLVADELLREEGVKLYRAQGARIVLQLLHEDVTQEIEYLQEERDGEEESGS